MFVHILLCSIIVSQWSKIKKIYSRVYEFDNCEVPSEMWGLPFNWCFRSSCLCPLFGSDGARGLARFISLQLSVPLKYLQCSDIGLIVSRIIENASNFSYENVLYLMLTILPPPPVFKLPEG